MKNNHSTIIGNRISFLAKFILSGLLMSSISAIPVVGVDFDDDAGGDDMTPDDLELSDGITVSDWVFSGEGGISGVDNNSNVGRPDAPVRKFNGPNNSSSTPPAVGDAPPTLGVHSFTISIDASPIDLNKVQFDFSAATGSANIRWIAFRTSLDTSIIFSQVGEARPEFPTVEVDLSAPKYANLSDQDVKFIWYCGGQGSGDLDIDSIIIDASGGSFIDVDNDLLADSFEQAIIDADPGDAFVTIADVLPGDDFDVDGADNLTEQDNGTDPQLPDTDGDGIKDGPETDTGTYNGLTDTGTDPLDPDTDDDGLLDRVETNTGTYVDPMNTGTDPFLEDSDSDNFRDGAEVKIHGTDPSNAAQAPSGLTALFVGGSVNGTTGADALTMNFIQDKYGISNVTYLQASLAKEFDEDGYDLLVISSTPDSGDVRDKFEDTLVPVVNWEEAISDNLAGEFGLASAILTKSILTTAMVNTGHSITEGLPDPVVLFEEAGPQTTSTGALFPGLTSAGNDADSGEAMIFLAEEGDALDPGALVPGNVAPARRVMLPWTDNTVGTLTPDGWTVFGNALDWAVGRLGRPEPLRITEIQYDNTSQPGNVLVRLTFNSSEGQLYGLYADTGLDLPIPKRLELDDGVTAAAESTTVIVNFNDSGLDINSPAYFFTIKEN